MADSNSTRPPPGVEILQDLAAAIAGATCLLTPAAPADDLAHARTLLLHARERASTLREVLHG
jgi:hypothetical protein